MKAHFKALKDPFLVSIRPQHRYNFDETGVMEGHSTNNKVVGPAVDKMGKKLRYAFVKKSGNRTWVSVIEYISAEGNHLPPVVIFKGQTVQAQWFPANLTEFATWKFTAEPKAWTCSDIASSG